VIMSGRDARGPNEHEETLLEWRAPSDDSGVHPNGRCAASNAVRWPAAKPFTGGIGALI